MLWDAHCHLHDARITDLSSQLEEARSLQIQRWVVCATGPEDWERVQALVRREPGCFPAYGVHPWYLDNLPSDWEPHLFGLLAQKASFVGECGLDFEKPQAEWQEKVFSAQLAMAAELELPLNIHCRKAWHRLLPLLKPVISKIPGFIVHAYSQNLDVARSILTMGGFVSFACHILRPWNQHRYEKLLTALPLEGILIETDAPDIPLYTPETGLSGLSRLSHLALVADQICQWKGISRETLEHQLKRAWDTLVQNVR